MGVLEGKVAIVTGAGRGIGRGEALTLAAEGAAVVVNDVDGAAAAAVVDEVVAAGGRAIANGDDVASFDGAAALVAAAVDGFGRLDVVVNNAGFLRDRMSFSMSEAEFDDVLRVHVKGHFAVSKFAAEHWRAVAKADPHAAGGAIVNTTSEAGLYGGTGQANYVAAKAGIAGMTIGLARELERYRVRVNAIAPRARTQMTEALLGDFAAAPADGGFDEWAPENIGPIVAWLASDAAADVNGQVFVVTGGRIHRFQGWTMVGEIEQGDRWSVDGIAARADELFAGAKRGIPTMGFGR
jgi:NAD(P)-dependent dehydrogenase (short-subunit alcohol dehydrogenase family)